jgi:hypothetical protein
MANLSNLLPRGLLTAVTLSSVAIAAPASADIIPVPASSIQGDNVLFNDDKSFETGTEVDGFTNDGRTSLTFKSTETLRAGGGQAEITGDLNAVTSNPNDTLGITNLTFALTDGGTFNNVELSLFAGTATKVAFTLIDNMGTIFSGADFTFALDANGENRVGFQAINGHSIASLWFRANGTIDAVKQIRLDAVTSAIPEPAVWAMMLIGFGGIGSAMRRRKLRPTVSFA